MLFTWLCIGEAYTETIKRQTSTRIRISLKAFGLGHKSLESYMIPSLCLLKLPLSTPLYLDLELRGCRYCTVRFTPAHARSPKSEAVAKILG